MDDPLSRFVADLIGRISGPLHLRLILQPTIAIILAIRDGRKDAVEGRVPFFWSLFTERGHRRELIRRGWKSVGKVFIIALIIDTVYQFIAQGWFYPGEALFVGLMLAIVPYVLLRGPANRLLRDRKYERTHAH